MQLHCYLQSHNEDDDRSSFTWMAMNSYQKHFGICLSQSWPQRKNVRVFRQRFLFSQCKKELQYCYHHFRQQGGLGRGNHQKSWGTNCHISFFLWFRGVCLSLDRFLHLHVESGGIRPLRRGLASSFTEWMPSYYNIVNVLEQIVSVCWSIISVKILLSLIVCRINIDILKHFLYSSCLEILRPFRRICFLRYLEALLNFCSGPQYQLLMQQDVSGSIAVNELCTAFPLWVLSSTLQAQVEAWRGTGLKQGKQQAVSIILSCVRFSPGLKQ